MASARPMPPGAAAAWRWSWRLLGVALAALLVAKLRCRSPTDIGALAGQRVAIGSDGSGAQRVARLLLSQLAADAPTPQAGSSAAWPQSATCIR